ncbi:lactonase family protein [Gorillibacterium sp. sgz500922]|uniref:lactonase family protein n=1 Tax=Gorillibacterium sp. sgz500922 TaxID=3446694 RepID=UPI003F677733
MQQAQNQVQDRVLFIGTYAGEAETGIHIARFDAATGELTRIGGVSGLERPSFLHYDAARSVLYAVSEAAGRDGEVAAFRYRREDNRLELLGRRPSGGDSPCHLRPNPHGTLLAAANYMRGGITLYPLDADGRIGEPVGRAEEEGTGPRTDRQEAPHPHSVNWSADGRFLHVPDLGTDRIRTYRPEAAAGDNGTVVLQKASSAFLQPGSGPRHLVLHPRLSVAYSVQELDSTVVRFRADAATGKLTPEGEALSLLPAEFEGHNDAADLHLSPDGRFLYASNRGHDSIAVFAVAFEDGALSPVEAVPTGGQTPRNFAICSDGRWLLSANQGSGTVTVLKRDRDTGRLTGTPHRLEGIPQPVCLEWA